ncbi:hypothetical protein HY3_14075 [Hyphomonas pacifica]|uniref:TNase-like domain-containing protein n=2 Tax=Hyphomonas pacifica TaxID=1280941 RepID=A0A8B2PMZ2_9PROT|nr:hypothetical protein HY3_14075 [Hyphomonas pacifica]
MIWLVCALAACSKADPMQGLEPGERGRVVRVIDGDALVLDTGQSVRLIGIEAPARPYKEREGQPYHEESKRLLEDMVLGREVQLHYAGLTRDRYDRALAHVRTTDALGPTLWLNAEMVRRGGARVRVYPDTALANEPLLKLEKQARAAKEGLWHKRAYRVPSADRLPDDFTGFQLVEGHVTDMMGAEGIYALCELAFERSELRLTIGKGAAHLCQSAQGQNVRARGYVREMRMEISHPLDLEVLGEAAD